MQDNITFENLKAESPSRLSAMKNNQLETTVTGRRKPRISKGKLRKSVAKKNKRYSQGFSTSYTQKTLHNNTLLAQSLAKEKSRNEKLLESLRELMTSRNEALMRLNETELSFDRLGMLVQKGIKQMQHVASTLGEIFVEIRTSKNNPRDSASMRSSWDETVTSVGRATIPQQLVRINGMQENVGMNDRSPQYSLQPVSPIEEELELKCDEDEIRDNSLLCRKLAPTPQQQKNNMKEFNKQVYAQDPQEGGSSKGARGPLKMPRKINMKWGQDLVEASPSKDVDVDRTSVSVVDMEETVIDEGTTSDPSPFNTVRPPRQPHNGSPDDLSYEQVFGCDKTDSEIPGPTNINQSPFNTVWPPRQPDSGSPVDLSYEQVFGCDKTDSEMPRPGLGNAASGKGAASPHTSCRSYSPDFLGFSVDNTKSTKRVIPYCYSSDEESTLVASSPEIRLREKLCNEGWSSSDDKPISRKIAHSESPGLVQKPNSKISKVTPSPSENVLNSSPSKKAVRNIKKSKLTKNTDHNLAVDNPSTAKTPSLSKTVFSLHKTPDFLDDSSDNEPISQKNVRNKSPGLVQKQSSKKSLKVTPSPSENVLHSGSSKKAVQNTKKSKLTKNTDPNSAVDNPLAATPFLTKTIKTRCVNSSAKRGDGLLTSSGSVQDVSKCLPATTSDGKVKPKSVASSTMLPLEEPSTPLQTVPSVQVTSEVAGNPETTRSPTVALVKSAPIKSAKSKAKRVRLPTKLSSGLPAITPDFAHANKTPLETKSVDERPRASTVQSSAASKSVDAGGRTKRPRVARQRLDTDVPVSKSPPRMRSWKRVRQGTPLTPDANETPSRGSRGKTPNVVALVNKLGESSLFRASEYEGNERRILSKRKATHANYKEPSLHTKIRRPSREEKV